MSDSPPTVEHGADDFDAAAFDAAGTTAGVATAIRAAILAGDLAPRQRLVEADLSAAYGTTRTAVRTALFELVAEGLVEREPNKGSRVRSISVAEAIEILEVRIGLESLVAAKAAERLTDAEAFELGELRSAILAAVTAGDLLEYSRLHQELDTRIRDLSCHATAIPLLERLRAQGARHQFRLSFQPGRAALSAPEHVAILDAVVARDPAAAAEATRTHLLGVVEALRALG